MEKKIKYFRVFSESAWRREDIATNLTIKAWELLKCENPCFFDVTKISTDKEELMKKAREERERIRWSQSYSRNPQKMVHKVYIHEVDADGNYILTKKEKESAIAWANARAMSDVNFAMENAEILASLNNK